MARVIKEEEERYAREEQELADQIYNDAKDQKYQYFKELFPRVAMFDPAPKN